MKEFARKTAYALFTSGFILAGAACGDGGGGGGGGSADQVRFVGIVAADDGLASGSIVITVATTTLAPPAMTGPSLLAPVNATGTLSLGGTQTSLSGTYDPDTDILAVAGGGYSFGGGFDDITDRLEGIWSGPGNTSGTSVTTSTSGAVAYCGTFSADDQTDSGTFSIVLAGSILSREAVSTPDGTHEALDGIVAATRSPSTSQRQRPPWQSGLATATTYTAPTTTGKASREAREPGAERCASTAAPRATDCAGALRSTEQLLRNRPGTCPGRFAFRASPCVNRGESALVGGVTSPGRAIRPVFLGDSQQVTKTLLIRLLFGFTLSHVQLWLTIIHCDRVLQWPMMRPGSKPTGARR